jgi:hypothetical protein
MKVEQWLAMTDTLFISAGCMCLGLTIGWLVRFFVEKYKEYDAKILNSTVTVFFGGCVVAFLKWIAKDANTNLLVPASFYLIGLPIGMLVLYPMVRHWDTQFRLASTWDELTAEGRSRLKEAQLNAKLVALTNQIDDATGKVSTTDAGQSHLKTH